MTTQMHFLSLCVSFSGTDYTNPFNLNQTLCGNSPNTFGVLVQYRLNGMNRGQGVRPTFIWYNL